MYDAYVAEEVAKKLPFDATCIASHSKSEKLLVGSKSGALVFCQPNKEKRGFDYQACKTFERRAIVELKVLEEEDLIMCLTDSQVNVHSVDESFTTVHSLNRYKPVTAFAFYYGKGDTKHPLLPSQDTERNARLLVIMCARKRFYLFELVDDEFRELELSLSPPYLADNAQTICWCGPNAVVFAARSEYFYVSVRTDQQEAQIADEGTLGEVQPLNVSVSVPEVPLLVPLIDRDVVGIYKDHQVMFITSSGHAAEDMPKCRFSDSLVALAYDAPYLIGLSGKHVVEIRSISPPLLIQKINLNRAAYLCIGSSGSLYAGSERMAWKLDSKATLNANLKLLLDERQFELALSLVQRNNNAEPKLRTEIRRRFAHHLFTQKKFHECFTMHAEMGTEVLFVLYFTRHLIPIPAEFNKPISENERKDELRLFEAKVELAQNEWKSAVLALGDFLSAKRTEFARRLEMHRKASSGAAQQASKNALLSPKDLQACENNLKLVDTVLLKCYVQTKPMMVPSLLRLADNSCMLDEAEHDLRAHEMWPELYLIFERRGAHEKVLELFKAEAHRRDSEFYGPEHAATYLYQLGLECAELIFKHASWIIRENVDIGLQIFVSSKSKAAQDMNHEEVLKFLKKECVAAIPLYLERRVYDWGEMRPMFHEILVEHYIIQIKDLLKNNVKVLKDNEYFVRAGEDVGPLGRCRENLVRFLRFSKVYNAQKTLDLLDFGKSPPWLFSLLRNALSELMDERAVVLGRLGRHEESLFIYVTVLKDNSAAEEHCETYFDAGNPITSQLFSSLVRAYTIPRVPSAFEGKLPSSLEPKENVDEALRVLQKHANKIDTVSAVSILPSGEKLQKVWPALESVLETTKNKSTSSGITAAVTNLAITKSTRKLKKLAGTKIVIDYAVECLLCMKRVTTSAFVRYPDGNVAHYFCYKKFMGQSTQ